jgi:hypothetical protein
LSSSTTHVIRSFLMPKPTSSSPDAPCITRTAPTARAHTHRGRQADRQTGISFFAAYPPRARSRSESSLFTMLALNNCFSSASLRAGYRPQRQHRKHKKCAGAAKHGTGCTRMADTCVRREWHASTHSSFAPIAARPSQFLERTFPARPCRFPLPSLRPEPGAHATRHAPLAALAAQHADRHARSARICPRRRTRTHP